MRGGCRVDNQCFCITHIGKMTYELYAVYEFIGRFFASFYLECKYTSISMLQVFLCQRMIRIFRQTRVFHKLNLRLFFQPLRKLQCIVYMSLYPQGKSLQSLKQQERVEGTQRGSIITQTLYPCP